MIRSRLLTVLCNIMWEGERKWNHSRVRWRNKKTIWIHRSQQDKIRWELHRRRKEEACDQQFVGQRKEYEEWKKRSEFELYGLRKEFQQFTDKVGEHVIEQVNSLLEKSVEKLGQSFVQQTANPLQEMPDDTHTGGTSMDLSQGQYIGDEEVLIGKRFWVDCGWSNIPIFYVVYYILISGGFTSSCFRPSRTVSPILDDLDRHVWCWRFDNLTTSFTHWRQCGDLLHFVPSRTPRNSWFGVLCKCGLCYMLFLLYVFQYTFVYTHHTTVTFWWDLGHSSTHC
jgi:hypothetical protein